jgi:hypothetical protein
VAGDDEEMVVVDVDDVESLARVCKRLPAVV